MSWTGRSEAQPCCGVIPGEVKSQESLVRLLHTRIDEPEYEPISRRELMAPKDFSNACGQSNGVSVTRSTHLSDDEVCQRAESLAALRAGREGRGGIVASVEAVRAVRLPGNDRQVCFVYDDPTADDEWHAVIRACETLPRVEVDEVRVRLRAAFSRRIRPDQPPPSNDDTIFVEGQLRCVVPNGK